MHLPESASLPGLPSIVMLASSATLKVLPATSALALSSKVMVLFSTSTAFTRLPAIVDLRPLGVEVADRLPIHGEGHVDECPRRQLGQLARLPSIVMLASGATLKVLPATSALALSSKVMVPSRHRPP